LFSRGQALKAQQAMRRFVAATPELADSTRYAMSIPGIGWIVATYAIARIGDWRTMGTSDQTASFFGLAQCEDSTGETATRGSITKTGDPVMRSLLIEAAWVTKRTDPELAAFYRRVYQNHANHTAAQVAIVAVARKLTTRLHCVLKERRVYRLKAPEPETAS
jgi:transposase